MANAEDIAQAVRTYTELVASGTSDDVTALYTDDASVEDPVGGDVHQGKEAIRGFYQRAMDGRHLVVDLLSLHVTGGEAAFLFRVTTDVRRLDIIDVMTFDDDAKITSMKAYWGPANAQQS